MADLTVQIGKLKLKNPVLTASGTFGYGLEIVDFFDPALLGAIVTKGLSLKPKKGNATPRIAETASGMLNAIGLQNIGVNEFVRSRLPLLKKKKVTVIANVFGTSPYEYSEVSRILTDTETDGLELNISCPNVKAGGIQFGTNPAETYKVVSKVRKVTKLPLIVKLSPNVTDITEIALASVDAGADALSLINTITALAIDIKTRKPKLANVTGGLSGPAIKPVALRMVWEVYKKVKIPLIGIGGIMTAEDAVEFFIAGASVIQVGTATFIDPFSPVKILEGLKKYIILNKIPSIRSLTGSLKA